MSVSGSGSVSSPLCLYKVGRTSCAARCLSPTPTRLRHPASAGPPPRHRFAHGWGRRRVSAPGFALRGPVRALPAVLIAAISRLFGRISESPADHGHPSRHRARLRLRAASRRAAMVSQWGGLRLAGAVVGGVVGRAIARAASDGPTARHLPPVSYGRTVLRSLKQRSIELVSGYIIHSGE